MGRRGHRVTKDVKMHTQRSKDYNATNKIYNLKFILSKLKKVRDHQLELKMNLEKSSDNENQIENSRKSSRL